MQSGGEQITFSLDLQLDQSVASDAGELPVSALADCVNLVRDKDFRLVKRYAYRDLSSQPTASTVRLITNRDTLANISASDIQELATDGTWVLPVQNSVPRVSRRSRKVVIPSQTTDPKARYVCANGLVAAFWVDSSKPYFAILDGTTGAILRGPAVVNSTPVATTSIEAVALGTTVYILIANGTTIYASSLGFTSLLTGSFTLTTISTTADSASPYIDIGVCGSNLVFAWTNNPGTRGVRLETRSTGLAAVNNYTFNVASGAQMLCINATTTRIWAHWVDKAGNLDIPNVRVWDSTLTALAAAVAGTSRSVGFTPFQRAGLGRYGSDSVAVLVTDWSIAKYTYSAGTITIDVDNMLTRYFAATPPFEFFGELYVWAQVGGHVLVGSSVGRVAGPGAYYGMLQISQSGNLITGTGSTYSGRPHCSAASGRVATTTSGTMPRVSQDGTTGDLFFLSHAVQKTVTSSEIFTVELVPFVQISTVAGPEYLSCGINDTTYCAGAGVFCAWDSANFFDVSLTIPLAPTIGTSAVGGSIAAGSYQYAMTWEFTDRAGNVSQSSPTFSAVTTYAGATSSATFTSYSTDDVTWRTGGVSARAVFWRTTVGPGSIFYRLPSSTSDVYTDAQISANESLYTSNGELANEPWPSLYHAVVFGTRIAAIDAEFRDRIVFSKPIVFGRGPEYSGSFETFVRGIGELTALAAMDNVLYAFSKDSVAIAAYGDGPDATGAGAWPSPQIVSRAAGTIDGRSLCVTQDGILFCSSLGNALRIWLLPRGAQNPVEIGRKVQDYLAPDGAGLAKRVTAVTNNADDSRAYVSVYNVTSGLTYQLEYDYQTRGQDGLGFWSVTQAAHDSEVVSSSVMLGSTLYRGTAATGGVHRYVPGNWSDLYNGTETWVPYLLRTHRVKLPTKSPVGKVNSITVRFEAGNTIDSTVAVLLVGNNTDFTTFAFPTGANMTPREWQPTFRRGDLYDGFAVEFLSTALNATTNSADAIPRDVSIDYLTYPGAYRPAASERT